MVKVLPLIEWQSMSPSIRMMIERDYAVCVDVKHLTVTIVGDTPKDKEIYVWIGSDEMKEIITEEQYDNLPVQSQFVYNYCHKCGNYYLKNLSHVCSSKRIKYSYTI